MRKPEEKGIALIITLILVLVMSVMAISLMFVSQTETWSSFNYRLMSQSRDGAEAGLNSAANYIVNTYAPPGSVTDPTTVYNTAASPVQYPLANLSGHNVILSAMSGITSNYPVTAVQTAFNTAGVGKGSITVANTTANYATYATLMSMHTAFKPLGTNAPVTVQTWKIVSNGTITGVKSAEVEVSATLEQHIIPAFNYAVFATDNGCSALAFGGGGNTGSYDSSTYSGTGTPTIASSGGDVGTNGNLSTNGNTTVINGDLFTPKTGVGNSSSCTASNVNAWSHTGNGTNQLDGSVVALPQGVTYPTPIIPAPGSLNISLSGATCPSGASAIAGCLANNSTHDIYIPPGNYGNISFSGQVNLHFSAGIYNINSLQESGNNTSVIVDDKAPITSPWTTYPTTSSSGAVILNVTGSSANPFSGNVVDLTGNSVQNASLISYDFQIQYAGTGNIALKGNTQASGVVYAPNATFSFNGNSSKWYGSIVGKDMTDMGGVSVEYDRHLQNKSLMVGPWLLDSFTWKKD